ncbi:MAG: putative intracellular protease/amidase [Planctomycetota bacterium]|jgi:putative intracellular protease/amidase
MADSKSTDEQELDADGLIIQTWKCRILIVLPPDGFGDQILRYIRSSLHNIAVGTFAVSSQSEELIKGRLQDEFLIDGPLADASMDDFAGLVICGNEGQNPLATDPKAIELIKAADTAGKVICGWGNSLDAFTKAGIVNGKRLTGPEDLAAAARAAGAKYSGREVASNKNLLTARDESSGMRLGQLLVEHIRISEMEDRQAQSLAGTDSGRFRRRALLGLGVLVGLAVLAKVTIDLFGSLHAS